MYEQAPRFTWESGGLCCLPMRLGAPTVGADLVAGALRVVLAPAIVVVVARLVAVVATCRKRAPAVGADFVGATVRLVLALPSALIPPSKVVLILRMVPYVPLLVAEIVGRVADVAGTALGILETPVGATELPGDEEAGVAVQITVVTVATLLVVGAGVRVYHDEVAAAAEHHRQNENQDRTHHAFHENTSFLNWIDRSEFNSEHYIIACFLI